MCYTYVKPGPILSGVETLYKIAKKGSNNHFYSPYTLTKLDTGKWIPAKVAKHGVRVSMEKFRMFNMSHTGVSMKITHYTGFCCFTSLELAKRYAFICGWDNTMNTRGIEYRIVEVFGKGDSSEVSDNGINFLTVKHLKFNKELPDEKK